RFSAGTYSGPWAYSWRSVPQIPHHVGRTRTSLGPTPAGSATSSTRRSRFPCSLAASIAPASDRSHAAVGSPHRAGHVRGLVRGEERDDVRHLLGRALPAERDRRDDPLVSTRPLHVVVHRGVGVAGDHPVHPDAFLGVVVRHH